MKPWAHVHLTRARQVGELMGLRGTQLPAPEVPVREYYDGLRGADPRRALDFIGHALPRAQAVGWAAQLVNLQPSTTEKDRAALAEVLAWIDQPSDERRWQAHAFAQQAGDNAPERTVAAALFYSGGSIAPLNMDPVLPAPGLSNSLAVVAVVQAAYRSRDPQAFFTDALRRAEAIAEHGIAAHP